jgi:hypothetical protein
MSTQLATQVQTGERRRLARTVGVSLLGPLTAAAGVVWAVAQPYRVTLLHPYGQGFWNLVVEPPLLVVLVGVLFQLLVLPALLDDLAEGGE